MSVIMDKESKEKLPDAYQKQIAAAFPAARITSAKHYPEPWMPIHWRLRLESDGGWEKTVDIRAWAGILPTGTDATALHAALTRLGLPTPTLLAGPFPNAEKDEDAVIAEIPKGRNLLFWALEGDIPHRIRAATALTIAAIDQLHGVTDGLRDDPVGATLDRRPLSVDFNEIIEKGGPWLSQPLFAEAITKLTPIVAEIAEKTPLVYTNDLYFPNFLRIPAEREEDYSSPFGWPGDPRAIDRPITEFIIPWGWLGDPLLGLAKYWTYDCYPFVHTGLVERYLFEKGYTKRDFAPRLAVRALWTLQRELPVERPAEGPEYYDAQLGLLRYALESL